MSGRYPKRIKHNWRLGMFFLVLVVVSVFLLMILYRVLKTPEGVTLPKTEKPQMVELKRPPTESETEIPTTEITERKTVEEMAEQTTESFAMPSQPAVLTALLDNSNVSYEDLTRTNCSQLVTVSSIGTAATIRFFVCEAGVWEEVPELNCEGHVGWNGVTGNKQEGDGCTPSGLFGIGSAFYITNLPDTKLDTFQISDNTYWVDDPNSMFYNQRVEGTQNKDWNSAEHMISYDVYRYGFVVDYNPQAEINKGSAIFFHVGGNSTAGCVSTDEPMVLAYLIELDKDRNPHILIINGDKV